MINAVKGANEMSNFLFRAVTLLARVILFSLIADLLVGAGIGTNHVSFEESKAQRDDF